MAGMLSMAGLDFAAALVRVGGNGASKLPGILSTDAQRELLEALEGVDFQRAPERVGSVYQDFDLLDIRPAGPCDVRLSALHALCAEFAAFARGQALALNGPWLADYAPSEISVQRYRRGSQGIAPHRDSRRYVKLISIFSLGSPAELRLCRDREGSVLRRYRLASGDLLLLRAPGFAGQLSAGPLHSVSGPMGEVRYSISLRMERQAETDAPR